LYRPARISIVTEDKDVLGSELGMKTPDPSGRQTARHEQRHHANFAFSSAKEIGHDVARVTGLGDDAAIVTNPNGNGKPDRCVSFSEAGSGRRGVRRS